MERIERAARAIAAHWVEDVENEWGFYVAQAESAAEALCEPEESGMKIDPASIRPGDEVTIRAKVIPVIRAPTGVILVHMGTGAQATQAFVDVDAIVGHTPSAIAPGERVVFVGIHGERNLRGTVLHRHESRLWVDWDASFPHAIVGVQSVERAPG